MKILAIDTATPTCSIALTDGEILRAEVTVKEGRSHSRHIMGLIEQVFDSAGLTLDDVDGFAVSRGPGSFTGLRIGISTAKGLVHALKKPLVGISSLLVLATQAKAGRHLICSMLDARKKEVYYAFYRSEDGVPTIQGGEGVLSPEKIVGSIDGPCMFIGAGALAYRSLIEDSLGRSALFPPDGHHVIRASTLAWIAKERFAGGSADEAERFVPTYVREPDAVLSRKAKRHAHNEE